MNSEQVPASEVVAIVSSNLQELPKELFQLREHLVSLEGGITNQEAEFIDAVRNLRVVCTISYLIPSDIDIPPRSSMISPANRRKCPSTVHLHQNVGHIVSPFPVTVLMIFDRYSHPLGGNRVLEPRQCSQ